MVRITNHKVIAQIVSAEIIGDRVLCAATSAELPRYGVKLGLTNYAAAYCTGLLVARRLLTKLGMAEMYKGNEKVDGEVKTCEGEKKTHYVAELGEKRPFRCYLDVGLRRTTTGARVFAVLKGANDGGLDIPHKNTRFYGYSREDKEYNAEEHRDKIFGAPIAEYMNQLKEENAELYEKQFSRTRSSSRATSRTASRETCWRRSTRTRTRRSARIRAPPRRASSITRPPSSSSLIPRSSPTSRESSVWPRRRLPWLRNKRLKACVEIERGVFVGNERCMVSDSLEIVCLVWRPSRER